MITRAQGAGRLRLPRPAGDHRAVRPDPPPRHLAVDRQLRPRRRGHQPHHGLPRAWPCCRPGMSQERFDWLDRWVADPADVVRTPGTESNVKEIYDACHELAEDPDQLRPQPVLPSSATTSRTTRSPGGPSPHVFEHVARAARPRPAPGRVRRRPPARPARSRAGDRLKESTARASWPSRRWSARRCSRTASASTTSRASATSTSR